MLAHQDTAPPALLSGVDRLAIDPGRNAALFLDVDGTLLDLAATPESVVVPSSLPDLLDRLSCLLGGALALVSGRSLDQLDRFFSPHQFAAGAQHGAEMRLSPHGLAASASEPALDGIRVWAETLPLQHPGVRVEDKGASIAIHYRQAPAAEAHLNQALGVLMSGQSRLEMLPAKMAFDVKLRGTTKGTAVRRLMLNEPFRGRMPIFVGDDVTDRYGMQAAQLLGGVAVQVGPAPAQHAGVFEDFSLASPSVARNWLDLFARELARPRTYASEER